MTTETKINALVELTNLLNKYEKEGIYFVCEADDFISMDNHILHDIQIVDALTLKEIQEIPYNED